ncbi:hypothetical protein BDV98DRAFT_579687 [Pterulicium gracile]|uniref:Uncharacterized protein n=1 Tax=Pterulicium gracile TaxID=1884261 RepID=A0A5C3R6I8_9AGAR|nr:hypothetical protein BDV98DRAFT_579687 [Pterula gracilis]
MKSALLNTGGTSQTPKQQGSHGASAAELLVAVLGLLHPPSPRFQRKTPCSFIRVATNAATKRASFTGRPWASLSQLPSARERREGHRTGVPHGGVAGLRVSPVELDDLGSLWEDGASSSLPGTMCAPAWRTQTTRQGLTMIDDHGTSVETQPSGGVANDGLLQAHSVISLRDDDPTVWADVPPLLCRRLVPGDSHLPAITLLMTIVAPRRWPSGIYQNRLRVEAPHNVYSMSTEPHDPVALRLNELELHHLYRLSSCIGIAMCTGWSTQIPILQTATRNKSSATIGLGDFARLVSVSSPLSDKRKQLLRPIPDGLADNLPSISEDNIIATRSYTDKNSQPIRSWLAVRSLSNQNRYRTEKQRSSIQRP